MMWFTADRFLPDLIMSGSVATGYGPGAITAGGKGGGKDEGPVVPGMKVIGKS